jgi:protein-disulfide isomerase
VRDGQRELRAKLEGLEKKIDAIASRPAPAAGGAQAQADPNKIYDLPVGDSPVRGPKDAPITLTEFSDFQCPFCASANTMIHQVLQSYPKEVKFVYKEFPLTQIHPNAMPASKAAQAAKLQGKYWEMHEKLFQNAKALDAESLKKYATEVGLDVAKWEKDKESPEVQKAIQADMQLAGTAGVRGTPTVFINGKRVTSRTVDDMKAMIDAALKEKKS